MAITTGMSESIIGSEMNPRVLAADGQQPRRSAASTMLDFWCIHLLPDRYCDRIVHTKTSTTGAGQSALLGVRASLIA